MGGHGWSFPKQRRNYWRETDHAFTTAIEAFTPEMFLFCMGTGGLAVLMHQNNYQFKGLCESGGFLADVNAT
jgi:hypothetical protein